MFIKRHFDLERCGLEAVWLELRPVTLPSLPLIICSVYRPPEDSISQVKAFSDLLEDCLSNISLPNSAIVLAGDLNARHSDWSPRETTNRAGREFRNLFSYFGLEQMVTFPTHFTPHGSTSCIDVVLTDHPHLLLSVTSLAPLGASDHAQILSHFLLPTDAVYREEPAANGHPAAVSQYHFRNVPGKPEYDFKSVPSYVWDSVNAELADICMPATSMMRFRTFLSFSTVPLRSTSGHSESSRILTAAHGPVSHPGLMPISAQQSSGNMISIAFLRSTQHNKTNQHKNSSEII